MPGFRAGDLMVMGGGRNTGKSNMMWKMAREMIDQGKVVLMVSHETGTQRFFKTDEQLTLEGLCR